MTTKQELQAIVEQLELIDLGEAQFYWGKGTMENDVNDSQRKHLLDAKALETPACILGSIPPA